MHRAQSFFLECIAIIIAQEYTKNVKKIGNILGSSRNAADAGDAVFVSRRNAYFANQTTTTKSMTKETKTPGETYYADLLGVTPTHILSPATGVLSKAKSVGKLWESSLSTQPFRNRYFSIPPIFHEESTMPDSPATGVHARIKGETHLQQKHRQICQVRMQYSRTSSIR